MKPLIKIKNNLFIADNDIISYKTRVANIEDGKIHVHGKYSRTTTKHISHVACSLKINRIIWESEERFPVWCLLDFGVKIKPEGVLGVRASEIAFEAMREGKSYLQALCQVLESDPSPKDRKLIDQYLNNFVDGDTLRFARSLVKVSNRFF